MIKRDLTKIFTDEVYSTPPGNNYLTNKIVHNHFDEVWSVDLADFSAYTISKNERYRYIFVIFDKFSKNVWTIPLKTRYAETITDIFSNILSISKRSPLKSESDRGKECYKKTFQNFFRK